MAGMVEAAPLREEKCPRCGSVYEVRARRLSLIREGGFDCLVCRSEIAGHDDTMRLRYILVKAEPWPKPKED